MVEIPERLSWLRREPGGPDWLAALPGRLEACRRRWDLALGEPFPDGAVSYAVRATRTDGSPAVLKLQVPHDECAHEADALAHWGGDGAVRLLAHAPEHHALLLEHCVPGTALSSFAGDRLAVFVALLPRLWKPAERPFRTLADEAAGWIARLPAQWERAGRPFARGLLDAGVGWLRELAASQRESVLVHQDLHGGNVLAAEREPWLAIDPKPLVGEPAFALAPVLRSLPAGPEPADLVRALDRLSADLSLDRERVRGWTIGQSLAWAFSDGSALPHQVRVAGWLHRA